MNFILLFKLLASRSSYKLTTSSESLAPPTLLPTLAEIALFAEAAYSPIPLATLGRLSIEKLAQPSYPLEGYGALNDIVLIKEVYGKLCRLHAYVAYRAAATSKVSGEVHRTRKRQLIVGISGTQTLSQTWQDLKVGKTKYPFGKGSVHSGFWAFYEGIREEILEGLREGLRKYPPVSGSEDSEDSEGTEEILITGHSSGGALAYLLMLEVLSDLDSFFPPSSSSSSSSNPSNRTIPPKFTLVTFGPPRTGDSSFVQHWRTQLSLHLSKFGPSSIEEYSLKQWNDPISLLPPLSLGYRHCAERQYYLYKGYMWRIPKEECENTWFDVRLSEEEEREGDRTAYKLGGHIRYSERDIEETYGKLSHLQKILDETGGEENWEMRWKKYVEESQAKKKDLKDKAKPIAL